MKKFCGSLRQHAIKIFNFFKKEMKLLPKEQQKSYKNTNVSYIYKEKPGNKYVKDKKCC